MIVIFVMGLNHCNDEGIVQDRCLLVTICELVGRRGQQRPAGKTEHSLQRCTIREGIEDFHVGTSRQFLKVPFV